MNKTLTEINADKIYLFVLEASNSKQFGNVPNGCVYHRPLFLCNRNSNSPEEICHYLTLPMEKVSDRVESLLLGVLSPLVCVKIPKWFELA